MKRERSYERERTNYSDDVRRGFDEIEMITLHLDGEYWLTWIGHFDLWLEWNLDHLQINYFDDALPALGKNLNKLRRGLANLIELLLEH